MASGRSINGESSFYFDKYTAASYGKGRSIDDALYSDIFLGHSLNRKPSDSKDKDTLSYEDQFLDRAMQDRPLKNGLDKGTKIEGGQHSWDNSYLGEKIKNKLGGLRSSFPGKNVPRLSKRAEKQLVSNIMQLSLLEGQLFAMKEKPRTMYVTSSLRGEGKTIAAVNMAYVLAVYSGKDTVLVDSNFSSPQIHNLFKAPNTIGLKNVFFEDLDLTEAILPTIYEHLYIIPSGNRSLKGASTIEQEKVQRIIKGLYDAFQYVIFDGCPVLSSSEPAFYARFFDGFILVVECEKTKWEVAQTAVKKIANSQGKIIGVVLNKRKLYIPEVIYRKI